MIISLTTNMSTSKWWVKDEKKTIAKIYYQQMLFVVDMKYKYASSDQSRW